MLLSASVLAMPMVGVTLAVAPAASAAAANGYVFNDAWTLGANARTQYTPTSTGSYTATSQLPSRLGNIGITAEFVPQQDRNPGSSLLADGTNQSAYGGQAGMFIGSPDPASLPALGVLSNAAQGCGGALGSAAHQNFNGTCNVGQLTLKFDRPVTDPILDISGLGGYNTASYAQGGVTRARGSFNTTDWSITGGTVQFASLSAGHTNLAVTPTTMRVQNRNSYALCNTNPQLYPGTTYVSPTTDRAGCGSVVLQGTFSEVTFTIDSTATPFSAFPTATHGTGPSYFLNDGTEFSDGINGALRS